MRNYLTKTKQIDIKTLAFQNTDTAKRRHLVGSLSLYLAQIETFKYNLDYIQVVSSIVESRSLSILSMIPAILWL